MSYMIRKAEKEDLPRIYEIYETARQFMRENGNHAQWGAGDRPEELLEDDISQGNLYVLEDAVADEAIIHAVFAFIKIMDYCKAQIPHLRIDTHEDNKVMQHVLEKYGFVRCGIVYVPDGSPRIAYELLEKSE